MPRHRSAFSLIDLIVVLAFVAVLAALIPPAAQSDREAARQTQCAANLRNLAMGTLHYSIRREQFPGWASTLTLNDNTKEQIGWLPRIFEHIDQVQLAMQLRGNITKDGKKLYQRDLQILHCSSDPPDYNAPLWSDAPVEKGGCGKPAPASVTKSKRPTSYAVNAGRPDEAMGKPDDPRFALFHDNRDLTKSVTVAFDEIMDGKAQTMMLTENIDLGDWTQISEAAQGVVFYGKWDEATKKWTDVPITVKLNDLNSLITPVDCNLDGAVDNLDLPHARPSSRHPGGVNMAYCDGRVEFFAMDPADAKLYAIYRSKLTPGAGD